MADPDRFIYNLSLFNNTPNNIPANIPTFARQTPLIKVPSDYYLSCIRFDVTASFPLFFPTIPDPAFPTTTNMSITLGFNGSFYQQFIQVTAQEAKIGVFSIGPFLTELNAASLAAFTAMKAANPGAPGQIAPYFAYDPDSQLVSMYVDIGWLESNPTPNFIYMNSALQLTINLPAAQFRQPPNPFGLDYQVRVLGYAKALPAVNTRYGFPYDLFSIAQTLIQVEQEFVQTNNFIGLNRLILTSQSIPVVPEYLPVNGGVNQGANTQNSVLAALADFSVAGLEHNDLFIQYLPTAEYRRCSMSSNSPLQQVDLQLLLATYGDQILQVMLPPQGSFTAQLYFERIARILKS